MAAIQEAVEINIACSLGILMREQAGELADLGVHRYNHNLEAARSYFPQVATTHTWEERWETLQLVREHGMEVCCGSIIGMGETLEQRSELAVQLGALDPDEVPLNFLDPLCQSARTRCGAAPSRRRSTHPPSRTAPPACEPWRWPATRSVTCARPHARSQPQLASSG